MAHPEGKLEAYQPQLSDSAQLLARFDQLLLEGNYSAANAVAEELELAVSRNDYEDSRIAVQSHSAGAVLLVGGRGQHSDFQ